MAIFALGIRPLAMLSVAGYAIYLAWQLWVWWKPYVLGASSEWQAAYAQSFARTLKVLPRGFRGTSTLRCPTIAQHAVRACRCA